MTRVMYQIYCLIILYFSVNVFSKVVTIDITSRTLAASTFLFPLLAILLALIGLLIQNFWQRVGLSFFFIMTMFLFFSKIGKISHQHHIWMFASVFLCFIDIERPLTSTKNHLLIKFIQSTLLSEYFISGLWKLKSLFKSPSLDVFLSQVLSHLAYAIAEGNGPPQFIHDLLADSRFTSAIQFGFLGVISFQVLSIVPILTNRCWKEWGGLAILFHLSTGFFMGIWFMETLLAAAFFLILIELWSRIDAQSFTKNGRGHADL